MTILLAIETATPACTVGLLDTDRDLITERFEIAPRRHTDLVLPMLDDLLSEYGVARSQIDGIAFGCGPGSFMGTRLATGVAQGLGYALDCPLIPISTLQILAQTAYDNSPTDQPMLVAWDARMQEAYWGVYQAVDGLMQVVQAEQLSPPVAITIKNMPEYRLVGNAWEVYRENFDQSILSYAVSIEIDIYPHALSLLRLALPILHNAKAVKAMDVAPIYLRNNVVNR